MWTILRYLLFTCNNSTPWRFAHSIDQLFWICQMVLSTYLISSSCLQILLPCKCTGSPTPINSTTGKYGLEFSAGCNFRPTNKAAPMSSQTVNTNNFKCLLKHIVIAHKLAQGMELMPTNHFVQKCIPLLPVCIEQWQVVNQDIQQVSTKHCLTATNTLKLVH